MQYLHELAFAKELAKKAGAIFRKNFFSATRTIKSNNTPVTEADIAVSKLVHQEIGAQLPDHAIMDEEQSHDYEHDGGYVWVCDPVDGTIPFSHRIPTSVFSLALCKNGKPVFGVAYDPYMDRLYHAVAGGGAFLNDTKVSVKDRKLKAGDTLFVIANWLAPFDYNLFFKTCHEKKLVIASIESFVYLSVLLAEGAIVGAVMPSAHPWDRAAAIGIVSEAGGIMTDEKGHNLSVFGDHRLCIASTPSSHAEILSIVQSCIAK